ncbi:alpha/beta fold hydrolase [Anaerolineales bacterium]
MQIIYLHGFASSPHGYKSNWFKDRFEADFGVQVHIPDLNQPSFEHLRLSAMLDTCAATVETLTKGDIVDDIMLIGSSLGGLCACHFLDQNGVHAALAQRIKRVILLAPAFDFAANRSEQFGQAWLKEWKESGSFPFYHYAHNREIPVDYGFAEDVLRYDSQQVDIIQQILIIHGKHDEVVNPQQSITFAQQHDNVQLHLVESDHTLNNQVEYIYGQMQKHFGLL